MGTLYQNGRKFLNMAPLSDTFDGPDYDAASMKLTKELKASLDGIVDLIYPVGSIYLSVNNVNPGAFLDGTTWEAYGAADTYLRLGGTGTGGANSTKLTAAQIPSLTTGNQSANHTHSGTTGTNSVNHTHTVYAFQPGNKDTRAYLRFQNDGNLVIYDSSGGAAKWNAGTSGMSGSTYRSAVIGADGTTSAQSANHTHTITTGNNSGNHTHTYTNNAQTNVAIEPKYIQTYAWKRTA